ncbi:hypothetical protein BN2475_710076 [Paraburkholderia ribeironis]|uniref:Uncharacterized protein n=1 Tax=Paraburkholderia ribeironis TaxID=1247936 RepID=A0A1N7SJH0_9BURK|nr:hypothetical protein BN2475_710076 [Paraburkholderia ribeironis]
MSGSHRGKTSQRNVDFDRYEAHGRLKLKARHRGPLSVSTRQTLKCRLPATDSMRPRGPPRRN